MIVLGTQEYLQLQRKNNPSDDPILGYCNVLDAILDLYTTRFDFFCHTSPAENPYLSSSFFTHVLDIVEKHAHKASSHLIPRYQVRAITAFLCFAWAALSRRTPPLTATPGSRPGPSCAISSLLIF